MASLDLSKNKEQNPSPAQEDYDRAKQQFDNGNFQDALGALSWGFQKDVDFLPLYELAVSCLKKLEAEYESQLFEAVLNEPNSFESFNNLGLHFYEDGHYDLALPFLEKAVSIDSTKDDTAHSLAIVYSRRFQIEKAIETLEINNPQNDFWNYWFWCKLRILAGKTEGIEEGLNDLITLLDQAPNQTDVEVPRQKVEEVLEILHRYNLIKDPRQHIQDWHFIQYGNVILDYFEDSDDYVAGGRYVASWGSNQSIRQISEKLKILIQSLKLEIQQVLYLEDRDSKIIGILIGMVLGIKATAYHPGMNSSNSLVVSANSYDFDDHAELSEVRKGQILFSLNHDWLRPAFISPDIVGFMSQSYYFPWNGGGIRLVDAEKGITEYTEPDSRLEEEIAKSIFNEKFDTTDHSALIDYYTHKREYLKSIGSKVSTNRFNFMIESPVPGSYFG